MIGTEKILYKRFHVVSPPGTREALSPSANGLGGYSVSPPFSWSPNRSSDEEEGNCLCETIARKSLFYLISTLNAAFPDYDFSAAKSFEFTKEPNYQHVMATVDSLLSVTATSHYSKVHDHLWVTMNEEIRLTDCEIYSYNPDLSSDPFSEDGSLWSFNYFFYNSKLKRIVFFTCRALSPYSQSYYDSGLGPDVSDDL